MEISGDSKTVEDWINGKARQRSSDNGGNGGAGSSIRKKGETIGRCTSVVSTAKMDFDWSDAKGICGFWDGSCQACGLIFHLCCRLAHRPKM